MVKTKNCPDTKFQTITFESQFRSSHTQMFFKTGVLKYFPTTKYLCWSLFLIKLKKRLHHRWFPMSIAKSLRTAFLWSNSGGCFGEFDKVTCSVLGICRVSVINQKHIVGWFLLKRFVDLGRVYSLHIISRNHISKFLLNLFKVKHCCKGYLFWFYNYQCITFVNACLFELFLISCRNPGVIWSPMLSLFLSHVS